MGTTSEMKLLSADALRARATELRETVFHLRIKHKTGTLESSAELSKNRKELARVLTVLGEVERAK